MRVPAGLRERKKEGGRGRHYNSMLIAHSLIEQKCSLDCLDQKEREEEKEIGKETVGS